MSADRVFKPWQEVVRRRLSIPDEPQLDARQQAALDGTSADATRIASSFLALAGDVRFQATTARGWAEAALLDYATLFVRHWTALDDEFDDMVLVEQRMVGDDAEAAATGIAPVLTILAMPALRAYELAIARPADQSLTICAGHVEVYAREWDVEADDLLRVACTLDCIEHLLCTRSVLAAPLQQALDEFIDLAEFDFERFRRALVIDPDAPVDINRIVVPDFDAVVDAFVSPRQREPGQRLFTLAGLIEGVAHHAVDLLLPPGCRRAAEAVRRRQLTPAEDMIGTILGARRNPAITAHGRTFVETVATRAGHDTLRRLWHDSSVLPTSKEFANPERWLDRVEA